MVSCVFIVRGTYVRGLATCMHACCAAASVTCLPHAAVEEAVRGLAARFSARSYSLTDNNCNTFAAELLPLLTGAQLPVRVQAIKASAHDAV